MNEKFIFGAAIGIAIGAAGAWLFAKKKYEAIAQAEIDSVKECYTVEKRAYVDVGTLPKDVGVVREKAQKIIEDQNYISPEPDVKRASKRRPYVIAPEDFDTIDEYDSITFTYYSDGVLADDVDEPVENLDDIVGEESLTHFGEYEDDSVYVRNDARKTDYEILLDRRKYSDVVKHKPHQIGV